MPDGVVRIRPDVLLRGRWRDDFPARHDTCLHGLRYLLLLRIHRMQLAIYRRFQRCIGLYVAAGSELEVTVTGEGQRRPSPLLQDSHWHTAPVQADLRLALRKLRNTGGCFP